MVDIASLRERKLAVASLASLEFQSL
jgi:hypothetical protein